MTSYLKQCLVVLALAGTIFHLYLQDSILTIKYPKSSSQHRNPSNKQKQSAQSYLRHNISRSSISEDDLCLSYLYRDLRVIAALENKSIPTNFTYELLFRHPNLFPIYQDLVHQSTANCKLTSNQSIRQVIKHYMRKSLHEFKGFKSNHTSKINCIKKNLPAHFLTNISDMVKQDCSYPQQQLILNLGFAKTGTTSLSQALKGAGFKLAHWRVKGMKQFPDGSGGHVLIGPECKRMASLGFPAFTTLTAYAIQVNAVTQMDYCTSSGSFCDIPQISQLEEILNDYPDAYFILTSRNSSQWLESARYFHGLLGRLKRSPLPLMSVPPGNRSDSDVKHWFEGLNGFILETVKRASTLNPKLRFLMLDLESGNQSEALSQFLNTSVVYGHANVNHHK